LVGHQSGSSRPRRPFEPQASCRVRRPPLCGVWAGVETLGATRSSKDNQIVTDERGTFPFVCKEFFSRDRRVALPYSVVVAMTASEPRAKNLADLYNLAPLEWTEVRRALAANLTQRPSTGGPDHHSFWLSTIDHDGRPHMTAVGAFWVDDCYYFCGSPRSRKIRNIERDPRCALGVAISGFDVTLEGRATRVSDDAMLLRLAAVFGAGGWAPTVADGGFVHEFSAPSAGPPPWYVYEFSFEDVYATATKAPGGATRWTF
jgi:hypothetical protein